MKRFICQCGQEIFFQNTHCNVCGIQLGFSPSKQAVLPLFENKKEPNWRRYDGLANSYRICQHRDHDIQCNWLIEGESEHVQCISCRTTRMIPTLDKPENMRRWTVMEANKRRMIFGLLDMGLSITSYIEDKESGLAFDFLEDQRTNVSINEEHILSGHAKGVITINVAEADGSYREATREAMNESFRSLLGHFRHEIGHYYWERLIPHSMDYFAFQQLFGNETLDYGMALDHYYLNGPPENWQDNYISAYASMHPLEDWAETWSHYMLMRETIETAFNYQICPKLTPYSDFDIWMSEWMELAVVLNALSRSIGNADAYPFIISETVNTKLKFIHRLVNG
jgi:hypothetical protein